MQGWIARVFTSFIDIPDKIATAIYFSGCSLRCKDCHNREIWEKESGTLMTDDELVKKISELNNLSEYVVFLGGEPTDQLDFLVHMCKTVKQEINKPIAMYTGREFEILPDELLENICMVVCGPYRKDLHQEGWPASSNQRVFMKRGNEWKS
ncbi:4Fe-4S cluster-binding domain-containing protein [Candidatus Dependentiae bacterium]